MEREFLRRSLYVAGILHLLISVCRYALLRVYVPPVAADFERKSGKVWSGKSPPGLLFARLYIETVGRAGFGLPHCRRRRHEVRNIIVYSDSGDLIINYKRGSQYTFLLRLTVFYVPPLPPLEAPSYFSSS